MSVPQIVIQHVVAAAVCLVGLAAAGGKRPATEGAQLALDQDGLGPVKVGMSVEDAERALGFPLTADREHEPDECHYVENRARLPGTALMVIDGRVVRVDVYDPGVGTTAGIQIGSTEEEVVLAYPGAIVDPSPYAAQGHSLRAEADGGHAMIFETDGARVVGFRAGEREAVGAFEGCE